MIDEKRLITDIEKNLVCVDDEQVKKHVNEAKNVIIKIIKHQPKVNEWIPVDERLPELAGYRCLATIENKYGQRKVADVFTNYGMYGVSPFWLSNAKEIDLSVWKVIAWQPLPKPYEVEENE